MKMLYIAAFNRRRDIGVYKKIMDQLKTFQQMGIEAKLVHLKQEATSCFNGKLVCLRQYWEDIQLNIDVDALYIRYVKSSYSFIRFLQRAKKINPKMKILIEIPTYPYEKEETKREWIITANDRIFRKIIRKYVDRIITFSDDRTIFNIKTIRAINGLNFSEITPRKILNDDNNRINVIAVASMKNWHGYDRMLEGLGQYYQKGGQREVNLYLVGDGPEIKNYRLLAKKYHITKHVLFCGNKEGEALDAIYDICDIGIVALGCHRKDLTRLSAIKSREYAAKGLPMMVSGYIDVFPADENDFIYTLPEDDSMVDIERLINWYDSIYGYNVKNKEAVAQRIRDIGFKRCDSTVALKPIYNFLMRKNSD